MLIVCSLTEPKELSVGSYLVEPTIPITGEIDVLSGHNAWASKHTGVCVAGHLFHTTALMLQHGGSSGEDGNILQEIHTFSMREEQLKKYMILTLRTIGLCTSGM